MKKEKGDKEMDMTFMSSAVFQLPDDLQRLKWAGKAAEFEKYAALHCKRKDLPEEVKRCIALELHKLKVNLSFYTLTETRLLQQIEAIAPGFSQDDLEKIALDLDWAYVEGKKRYYRGSVEALLKSNPILRNWPSLKTEMKDDNWVRNMTEKIMKKGGLRVETEVEKTIEVSEQAAQGHRLRIDIPYPSPLGSIMKEEKLIQAEGNFSLAISGAPARTVVFTSDGDKRRTFTVRYRTVTEIVYMSFEDFLKAREKHKGKEKFGTDVNQSDLSEKEPAILFTPFIRALSEKIVGGEKDKILIAKKIYDYMRENYRYSYVKDYAAIDRVGEYFALRGLGDCGLQSLLFITLCRYNGIPARWESGVTVDEEGTGCHDWALVYLEGTGWRPVDCSFGGGAALLGNMQASDFYFGNIDPYRIVFNTDVMEDFAPPKKYFRLDPYDNQIGEGETEERMLKNHELSRSTKVVYCRECQSL